MLKLGIDIRQSGRKDPAPSTQTTSEVRSDHSTATKKIHAIVQKKGRQASSKSSREYGIRPRQTRKKESLCETKYRNTFSGSVEEENAKVKCEQSDTFRVCKCSIRGKRQASSEIRRPSFISPPCPPGHKVTITPRYLFRQN
ncbi:hypothetical protein VTL71DRAFT_13671 [Oculimacula yallundae]|uniref:Uncharacterized protein n=1 Tax=Oculimacula yallundae TaxID=86028 RepID=A0ABR4CLI4_9HELO